MLNIQIQGSFKCEHPADCIYINKSNNDYFGVGFYNLEDERTQNRVGGIGIYDTKESIGLINNIEAESSKNELKPKLYINTNSGVVNFEWDQRKDSLYTNLLTCLCSDKTLKYYELNDEFTMYKLLSKIKPNNIDDNNNIIGLDLSSILVNGVRKTCYSISDGRVFIIRDLEVIEKEFIAHRNVEVWTISYLDDIGNIIGTGGDDCILSIWDTRMNLHDNIMNNNKTHKMGVTCIFKSEKQNNFWTGSYDEILRFWDIRKIDLPIYEQKLQGGIWRINKFENYLGVAECHFGFEYYKLDDSLNILEQYISVSNRQEISHKSLVYGIDTFRMNKFLYGLTCSFNDRKILTFKINESYN